MLYRIDDGHRVHDLNLHTVDKLEKRIRGMHEGERFQAPTVKLGMLPGDVRASIRVLASDSKYSEAVRKGASEGGDTGEAPAATEHPVAAVSDPPGDATPRRDSVRHGYPWDCDCHPSNS